MSRLLRSLLTGATAVLVNTNVNVNVFTTPKLDAAIPLGKPKVLWDTVNSSTKTATWSFPSLWGVVFSAVLFSLYFLFVYKDKREPISPYASTPKKPIKEGEDR